MKKRFSVLVFILMLILQSISVISAETLDYDDYFGRYSRIITINDISANGFSIIEDQRFNMEHEGLGPLDLIPAIDRKFNRIALFFIEASGLVTLKIDDFESNCWLKGQAKQTNQTILSLSYRDLNSDGLKDIIVICSCKNETGEYAGKSYNVGDVLFQNAKGYYRDWRVSDKINRFDMNKNSEAITALVRDGDSMEFLFTSKTLSDLINGGFQPINYQSSTLHLEKFGVVQIKPGFYDMTGQNYLMLYVVNSEGRILWNFQPMHDYVNFYDIVGISFKDIDGDGLKDLTILANYVTYDAEGYAIIKQDYDVYYQRAGYFLEDKDFKNGYSCTGFDNLNSIVRKSRAFWGWK